LVLKLFLNRHCTKKFKHTTSDQTEKPSPLSPLLSTIFLDNVFFSK
jgi:hypothetical protein